MHIKSFRNINFITKKDNFIFKTVKLGGKHLQNEVTALKILGGVCSPKLLAVYGDTIVTEFIDGRCLSEITINKEIIYKIAVGLNLIHAHKNKNGALIHGDLHKENIIIFGGKAIFIDFAESFFGDPLVDAAAIEIHVAEDSSYRRAFYREFENGEDRVAIDRYKIEHCRKYLEWAENEGKISLAEKSKKIIKEIENRAA